MCRGFVFCDSYEALTLLIMKVKGDPKYAHTAWPPYAH
jgi:hypothetical protein